MINISHLDHLVLTVADIDKSCHFYSSTLGMKIQTFGQGRKALSFGQQKINLHQLGREFEPKAKTPTAGSADLCLIASTPLADVIKHLKALNITIEDGPIQRTGATRAIISVYIRDPDYNLIEISNYLEN